MSAERDPLRETYETRLLGAERVLEFLRADVDRWEEHDRIDAGAAADARSSIASAVAWLFGDRDGQPLPPPIRNGQ